METKAAAQTKLWWIAARERCRGAHLLARQGCGSIVLRTCAWVRTVDTKRDDGSMLVT